MQYAAALQHGNIVRQPTHSSILLPAAAPRAFRSTAWGVKHRPCLSQHTHLSALAASPAAAGSSVLAIQPRALHLRRQLVCRALGSEPQPASSPNNSSSTSDAASSPSSSSRLADAEAAPALPLTVEAVQSDPAATIDAIQRLTSTAKDDSSPTAASDTPAAGADAGSDSSSHQQQSAFDTFLAAVAAAWAGAQVHWQTLVGYCAAALAAVQASLGKFPAWVAAQKLQKLQEAADASPTDGAKQAAYLTALNSNAHPR